MSQNIEKISFLPSLHAFRVFKLEVRRLEKLYDNSIYAYRVTRDSIYESIKSHQIDYNDPVVFNSFDGNEFKIGNAQSTAHNYRLQHPRYLRELIFIRLISALEIFLIDSLKDSLTSEKRMLETLGDKELDFKLGEILAFKNLSQLINKYVTKEARSLQSQGYEAIKKYYTKVLKVDFGASGVSSKDIERYHQERHLLVHNSGKTDEKYRHDYNTEAKSLDISEGYLVQVRQDIFAIALYVNNELSRRILSLRKHH